DMEKRVIAAGGDMRGGNPSAGNIAGGLTTIEEKSLGAIVKGGTRPIQDVYNYGERVRGKGLFVVDSPGREPEFLTVLAAAGAQVALFSTGLGVPQGFPFIPVIKVTGNPVTFQRLPDHIDMLVEMTAGERLRTEIERRKNISGDAGGSLGQADQGGGPGLWQLFRPIHNRPDCLNSTDTQSEYTPHQRQDDSHAQQTAAHLPHRGAQWRSGLFNPILP
ncbi:MAG: UxaA family hydrolase, partial [Chloroflexi bacterium]|nr:UxaA family hydrolase [Chloroflexota bacterium]